LSENFKTDVQNSAKLNHENSNNGESSSFKQFSIKSFQFSNLMEDKKLSYARCWKYLNSFINSNGQDYSKLIVILEHDNNKCNVIRKGYKLCLETDQE
jgi:hypothetical protein